MLRGDGLRAKVEEAGMRSLVESQDTSASVANLQQLAADSEMLLRISKQSVKLGSSHADASAGVTEGPASIRARRLAAPEPAGGMPTVPSGKALSQSSPSGSDLHSPLALFHASLPLIRQGANAFVDDSFTRCFKEQKRVPWNWNVYLG